MIKYNVFNLNEKAPLYPLDELLLTSKNDVLLKNDNMFEYKSPINKNYVFRRNTFAKLNNQYINEYDLLKISNNIDNTVFTGIVVFKKGVFYLRNIQKDGIKLNIKVALDKVYNNLNYVIKNLGSILDIENCYDYIRGRFFFETPDELNSYAVDNNCNLYIINDIHNIKTINNPVNLSIDVYDKNGDLLFENNKVQVSKNGELFDGVIADTPYNGYYLIIINNGATLLNINNEFNSEKYDYIILNS